MEQNDNNSLWWLLPVMIIFQFIIDGYYLVTERKFPTASVIILTVAGILGGWYYLGTIGNREVNDYIYCHAKPQEPWHFESYRKHQEVSYSECENRKPPKIFLYFKTMGDLSRETPTPYPSLLSLIIKNIRCDNFICDKEYLHDPVQ